MKHDINLRRVKTTLPDYKQSYDNFFMSDLPVTWVQFWGLMILGCSLIASGVSLMLLARSALSKSHFGIFEGAILVLITAMAGCFIHFGVMHIRRALLGRR